MTDQEYQMAAKRCCEIPAGENWNDRFLMALSANRLTLSNERQLDTDIMAPWPTADEPFRWKRESYIVRG